MKHYPMGRKGVKHHFSVTKDVSPGILCDATWLQDIIVNYLSNAHKFTLKGAISLSISVENTDDPQKAILLIEVKDTGPGISAEQVSKVFEPFVQLQTDAGGTGLGLASVASQAKALGGTFGAYTHSDPHGSVFWVRLPYIDVYIDPAGSTSTKVNNTMNNTTLMDKHESKGQRSVLIIDDTASILKMSRMVLEKRNLAVEEAEDGAVGLAMMKQHQFDIVLCDLMMPVMDGVECVRLYRKWAHENKVPYYQCICGLTANATPELIAKWSAAGVDNVFAKPLPVQQVMGVLDKLPMNAALSIEEIMLLS